METEDTENRPHRISPKHNLSLCLQQLRTNNREDHFFNFGRPIMQIKQMAKSNMYKLWRDALVSSTSLNTITGNEMLGIDNESFL